MSDFRVEVRYVKIYPHSNAEKVQLAQVDEFQAVVEKDRFQDNTLVAYIPEQAIVPDYIVDELHLEGKLAPNNRLKPARFRGILSQGLVYVPLSGAPTHWIEGLDVTEELGVTKYEPKVPVNMAGKIYVPPSNALTNSGIQTYTDIENIKKYSNVFQENELVCVTEKEHGSCLIVTKQGDQYFVSSKGIASRGFVLQEEDNNIYWRVVRQYNLFDKLKTISEFCPDFDPIYLYGEVIGVQDLMYGLKPGELAFYAFDLRYGNTYLPYEDFIPLCAHADIPTVPLLYKGPYTRDTINNLTSGRSVLDPDTIREGVVVRAEPPRYDTKLGRVVLKSISEDYLLRKNKNATEFQ